MPTTSPAGRLKLDVLQHSLAVGPVAEGDMVEDDIAFERRQRRAAGR